MQEARKEKLSKFHFNTSKNIREEIKENKINTTKKKEHNYI